MLNILIAVFFLQCGISIFTDVKDLNTRSTTGWLCLDHFSFEGLSGV